MFISTGFDYLNVHNPHIVCDKDYLVLTLTPSPSTFAVWEIPEILLAYILYILDNSKGINVGITVADTTTKK